MAAEIVRFRDHDNERNARDLARAVVDQVPRRQSATIIILPVIRVESYPCDVERPGDD